MLQKTLLFACLLFISVGLPANVSHASVSDEKIEVAYTNLAKKLEKRYSVEKQTAVLTDFGDSIDKYLQRKLSREHRHILSELQKHNNNRLFSLFISKNQDNSGQKKRESEKREQLKKQGAGIVHPSYINSLSATGKKIYVVDREFDFSEGETIQKVHFSQYFPLTESSAKQLSNDTGIIVYSIGDREYRFVKDYNFEEKISFSKLESVFDAYTTENANFFEEGGDFYSYIFTRYLIIDDDYGVFLSGLEMLDIDPDRELLYRNQDGQYRIVKNYEKRKLIDASIIDGIVDKQVFLSHLYDDKRTRDSDTDTAFRELKKQTEQITSGKTDSEKIESIYDWVISHVEYTSDIDSQDDKIFSGIDTYTNKDGVCTGYAKLTSYMLIFAGIGDTQVMKGDVIDAPDFPEIGHAWLRIGDDYYDPTFDDPIGATTTKTREQYRYFDLPKELFYANRFDVGETPEVYKKISLEKRKEIVSKNLYEILPDYTDNHYILLQPAKFRRDNNLSHDTTITLDILMGILPLYKVENNSFSFTQGNTRKSISSFKFFILDNNNAENVLSSLDYNLENTYLFDWELENSQREYRLGYDIVFAR